MRIVSHLGRMMAVGAIVLLICTACAGSESPVGQTSISKWKDDKRAVYLLSFDDEAPTQLTNVIPELNHRRISGTFYVVTGNGLWEADGEQWAEAAKSPYITLANHTFTHAGVRNATELQNELGESNRVLYGVYAKRPQPFLLGFAQPGGVPWGVSADEQASILRQHNLIERPAFIGSPNNYATSEQLLASVDVAMDQGEMGHNDMHGVGGDWLSTPEDWFIALLSKLEAERDYLWVPDFVSYAKYLAERKTAEVRVLKSNPDEILLSLTSKMDTLLYDYPLTLSSRVPSSWTSALVEQGSSEITVPVRDGVVMYGAVPGPAEIRLAQG